MSNIEYGKFISIIEQDEVVGKMAVDATKLLLKLNKNDLQKKDFKLIDSFITITRTSMTEKEWLHISEILTYIRNENL